MRLDFRNGVVSFQDYSVILNSPRPDRLWGPLILLSKQYKWLSPQG